MTDAELEAAIDRAGRDRVFALVQAAGWPPGVLVPKFVWWGAVRRASESDQDDRQDPLHCTGATQGGCSRSSADHDYSDPVTDEHLARIDGLVDQRRVGLMEVIFGPGW